MHKSTVPAPFSPKLRRCRAVARHVPGAHIADFLQMRIFVVPDVPALPEAKWGRISLARGVMSNLISAWESPSPEKKPIDFHGPSTAAAYRNADRSRQVGARMDQNFGFPAKTNTTGRFTHNLGDLAVSRPHKNTDGLCVKSSNLVNKSSVHKRCRVDSGFFSLLIGWERVCLASKSGSESVELSLKGRLLGGASNLPTSNFLTLSSPARESHQRIGIEIPVTTVEHAKKLTKLSSGRRPTPSFSRRPAPADNASTTRIVVPRTGLPDLAAGRQMPAPDAFSRRQANPRSRHVKQRVPLLPDACLVAAAAAAAAAAPRHGAYTFDHIDRRPASGTWSDLLLRFFDSVIYGKFLLTSVNLGESFLYITQAIRMSRTSITIRIDVPRPGVLPTRIFFPAARATSNHQRRHPFRKFEILQSGERRLDSMVLRFCALSGAVKYSQQSHSNVVNLGVQTTGEFKFRTCNSSLRTVQLRVFTPVRRQNAPNLPKRSGKRGS
ncbi:hypothetical protein R3P38DRAFT_2765317 [Favolaschia claudopus]|uniref:Ribosomal protein S3 n=1 Tax=Favolaschia claudopus TaxID=2862362 RepID=A0AAW0D232_9AGAR